jgi:quercetin dioxygenase-like cupin family protein
VPTTTKEPTGEYPKPAKVHHHDLEAAADELTGKLPGNRRQTKSLARESGVSVIIMAMEAGDVLDQHSADGVVTIQLLRGHATLMADGQPLDVRPEQLVMMEPGLKHNLQAEEQSVVMLTVTGGEP